MNKVPAVIVEEVSQRQARLYVAKSLFKFMSYDNGLLKIEDSFIVCLTDLPKVTDVEYNEIEEIIKTQPNVDMSFVLDKDELLDRLASNNLPEEDQNLIWTNIGESTPRYVFDVTKTYESHPAWEQLSEAIFAAIIRFCTPRTVELVGIYGDEDE